MPGILAAVPTAREQGIDVVWPIIRGVWMGPKVSDADYRKWVEIFERMEATPEFAGVRAAHGLYPFALTGPALTDYVKKAVLDYTRQAREFNLVR
jgi:putative tricarboxylic transport membrane protein